MFLGLFIKKIEFFYETSPTSNHSSKHSRIQISQHLATMASALCVYRPIWMGSRYTFRRPCVRAKVGSNVQMQTLTQGMRLNQAKAITTLLEIEDRERMLEYEEERTKVVTELTEVINTRFDQLHASIKSLAESVKSVAENQANMKEQMTTMQTSITTLGTKTETDLAKQFTALDNKLNFAIVVGGLLGTGYFVFALACIAAAVDPASRIGGFVAGLIAKKVS
jgi:hypothetical protein